MLWSGLEAYHVGAFEMGNLLQVFVFVCLVYTIVGNVDLLSHE